MKKLIALLLTLVLVLPCLAFAEEGSILEADPEELLAFNREAPVTDWEGNWVAVAAFIGEEYADDNEIDVHGLIAVPENAVMIAVETIMDGSATGSDAGVMVDQAAYLHAHVYDMSAVVTYAADIAEEEAKLYLPWDGWNYTVRGEQDGDFNMGVGKLSKVSADDQSLYFTKVTGVESEEIDDEKMKYVGLTNSGYLVVCYCEENLVKKEVEVSFGYIFKKAE